MNRNDISLGLKGMAMGMAEIVPGVSGGTIAFITGIYERLINAIKNISTLPLGGWKGKNIGALWKYIDGPFLLALVGGMFLGILVGIFGISYLLEQYPPLVWGFFFGLIIGSTIYIAGTIKGWKISTWIALVVGIVVAYFITVVSPAQGSENLLFIFVSGMIAISALILPGISGSFILLLLGMYTFVLHSVKDFLLTQDMGAGWVVIIFALGCLTGLMLFSNVLSWTLKHYQNSTLAVLTGFMIGSLNRIWPWRNPTVWLNDDGEYVTMLPLDAILEDYHIVTELNVLPDQYFGTPYLLGVLLSAALGLVVVFFLSRIHVD